MRLLRGFSIGAGLLVAAGLFACGGEDEGWKVRRFGTGDATHEAVRSELIGPCRVVHVVDGDTLDVVCRSLTDQVRMLRIDTPEAGRPGYAEARDALASLVEDRDVHLLFEEKGVRQRGNYGRLLAYVYAGKVNVNVEMVRLGWSTFWTKYGEGRFAEPFRKAEEEAKAKKRGLWAGS
jgi:endonuclease YncB( thermonuclease family)